METPVQNDASDVEAPDRSLTARWKHEELFAKGYVGVPTLFLTLYSELNPPLTAGEVTFVLQLMSYKWSKSAPYPDYGTIARRMGISDKAARRHAANLEIKKYLRRKYRTGTSNIFDLNPLFDALLHLFNNPKPPKPITPKKKKKRNGAATKGAEINE